MGAGGYSASSSSSATSGNKTSVGPVTFGATQFGNQGAGAGSHTWIVVLGVIGAIASIAALMFRKKP